MLKQNDKPLVNILVAPFTFKIGDVTVEEGIYVVEKEGETTLMTRDEFETEYEVDVDEDLGGSFENDLREFFSKLEDGDTKDFLNSEFGEA